MTRRAFHRGDGSHKRYETEQEHAERKQRERRDEYLGSLAEQLSEEYYAESED